MPTVIMKDIWSDTTDDATGASAARLDKLARGYHDFLYLFQHMASKSMCEAVVESMGGMWNLCSSDNRHLSLEAAAQEAIICWSAPQPWHPEAIYGVR